MYHPDLSYSFCMSNTNCQDDQSYPTCAYTPLPSFWIQYGRKVKRWAQKTGKKCPGAICKNGAIPHVEFKYLPLSEISFGLFSVVQLVIWPFSYSRPIASEKTPCYRSEAIAAVIEIRGSGLVNRKDKLEENVKTKRARFEDIKAINKNIKCLYLTLKEREITKGTNYDQLSKKHLGSDYFCLRESTTQTAKEGEWKRFVRALLDP